MNSSKRPVFLALLVVAIGCSFDGPNGVFAPNADGGTDTDAGSTVSSYSITGRLAPIPLPDYALPSALTTVTARATWGETGEPFPDDAPILATLPLAPDGSFHAEDLVNAEVNPGEGLYLDIAAVYTDDAEPAVVDQLVQVVSDRRIPASREVAIDALLLEKSVVASWQTFPALAGRDLEKEGMLLVQYLDAQGKPWAGVTPKYTTGGTEMYFLEADGRTVAPLQTKTTSSSGLVLWIAAPVGVYSGTIAGSSLESLGAAAPATGVFFETIGPSL